MLLEHKNANKVSTAAGLEVKLVSDTDGTVEGYGAVFNVRDNGGDTIMPGAFVNSLKNDRMPRMLRDHNFSDIIGAWTEAREDSRGLYVKGTIFEDIQKGKETLSLLRRKAIDGLSIGYRTRS